MLTKNPGRLVASLVALFLTISIVPAQAMGTGNPYQDAQSGLNYVVYQPSYTSGLVLKSDTLVPSCHKGATDAFVITYGSGKKFFTLTENSSKNMCVQNMMLIRGATRTVVIRLRVGSLEGTELLIISVGVPRVQLNKIFASMKAKYDGK